MVIKAGLAIITLTAFSLLIGGCAAQTEFSLEIKDGPKESAEYSFVCDNLDDLAACRAAENLKRGKNALRGESLALPGCPAPSSKTASLYLTGRIIKEDVRAYFYENASPCQKARWRKVLPLVKIASRN